MSFCENIDGGLEPVLQVDCACIILRCTVQYYDTIKNTEYINQEVVVN